MGVVKGNWGWFVAWLGQFFESFLLCNTIYLVILYFDLKKCNVKRLALKTFNSLFVVMGCFAQFYKKT